MTQEIQTRRVNDKVAAAELGCSVAYMHQKMKSGEWDLGDVVKPGRNGKRCRYFVYRASLDAHMREYRQEVEDVLNGKSGLTMLGESEMNWIAALCNPVIEYLREHYDPYTEITVSTEGISVRQTQVRIPKKR